ncbi:MAG: O-antigen ligase family protein [Chloroflexi bacterium]|nr:O-antigen ligase family protein [Chloroflexota bacterium]
MKDKTSWQARFQKITDLLWMIMIAVLPVTSMPLMAKLLGSDTVAAPAILVALFFTLIWFIPFLWNRGSMVKESVPLLVFFVVAVFVTVLANFRGVPAYKGINVYRNAIEAVITLVIGIIFYLLTSSYVTSDKRAALTMRIINWSGLLMLLWAGVQAVAWYGFGHYPQWMFDLQGMISSRVLYRQRINGMALEPSWFAHQLNMVYLPIWLSATIRKFTAHKWKLWFLSFENILLLGGVGALLLTLSRVGLLGFILMFTFLLIRAHTYFVDKILQIPFLQKKEGLSGKQKHRFVVWISLILIVVYLMVIVLGLWIFSRVDPRMESLFDFSLGKKNPLLSYFNELSFGERVVYWLAGWNVFTQHPLLGVGLGNAGFYFPRAITPYGWNLIEVMRLMYRTSILLNVKSLWARLLAETGLVGFSVFCGWIYSLAVKFFKRSHSQNTLESVFSVAGIFVLFALLAEGFSIDSFALPYLWVALGLASADLRKDVELREENE